MYAKKGEVTVFVVLTLVLLVSGLYVAKQAIHSLQPSLWGSDQSVGNQLTGAAIFKIQATGQEPANATQCGDVRSSITLRTNINATGTCFTVNASNIVIDCAGREINYSSDGTAGFGITNAGFANVTIKNCVIKDGSDLGLQKFAIQLTLNSSGSSPENNTIYNNTITTIGNRSTAILISNTNRTNITNNSITVSGIQAAGISLGTASEGYIAFNSVIAGNTSGAVSFNTAHKNTFIGNYFHAVIWPTLDMTAVGGADSNYFYNNTILSTLNFTIMDQRSGTPDGAGTNWIVYNGTVGMINWSLINLTTNINLSLGSTTLNPTIYVENNNLGLIDTASTYNLNGSTGGSIRLEIRGLTVVYQPRLLKAGVRCDNNADLCNITYNSTTGILFANVSGFSNYSTQEVDPPFVTVANPSNGTNLSSLGSGVQAFNATIREAAIDTVRFSYTNGTGNAFNVSPTNVSGNWNTNIDLARLTEGVQRMTVMANDTQAIVNYSESIDFTVDRIPPNVTQFLLNGSDLPNINASNWTNGGVLAFNVTANDSTLTVQSLKIGLRNNLRNSTETNLTLSRNFSVYHTVLALSVLPDGMYTLFVYANDTLNNFNNSVANLSFRVDATPPNVTQFLLNGSDLPSINTSNWTNSGVLAFNVTANDSTLTVQSLKIGLRNNLRNSTETNLTLTKNFSVYHTVLALSVLPDGLYTLFVYANDTLNNFNGSVSNLSFRIDTTPPNVTLFLMNVSNSSNFTGGVIQINASLNDSTTSVETILFGLTSNQNNSQFNVTSTKTGHFWSATVVLSNLGDGLYTIRLYGNDTLGNLNNTVTNLSFTKDTTAPNISAVASGSITTGAATISWKTNENANSTVQYGTSLALGSVTSSTSWTTSQSVALDNLGSDTLYYYNVTSCDIVGGCNTSSVYNFTTNAPAKAVSESSGSSQAAVEPVVTTPTTVVTTPTPTVEVPPPIKEIAPPVVQEVIATVEETKQSLEVSIVTAPSAAAVSAAEAAPSAAAAASTGPSAGQATATGAAAPAAAEAPVESRAPTVTETISVSFTNKGTKTIELVPTIEETLPMLVNEEKVKETLKENIVRENIQKGETRSEEEIQKRVEEETEALKRFEEENVQYLLGRTATVGKAISARRERKGLEERREQYAGEELFRERPLYGLSGITFSGERVAGRLLKAQLLDLEKIKILPGTTIEKELAVQHGLTTKSKQVRLVFASQGEKITEKEVVSGEVITGGAVDVDTAKDRFDVYFVIPSGQPAGNYALELAIEKEIARKHVLPLRFLLNLLGRGQTRVRYAEWFGPFEVHGQGFIFAQQFLYDPAVYTGDFSVVLRIYHNNNKAAEQRYSVTMA